MFKHGICGDRPRIPDGMPDSTNPLPPKLFANLGCPPALIVIGGEATEVHFFETAKDLVEGVVAEEQG